MNDGLQALLRLLERPLFTVGETPVTLISLALAIGLVLGIWWLASALERLLLRAARRGASAHANDPAHLARLHMISRLARYVVWVLGTIVVLNYVGLDLSSVALVGGAVAFGLGFGLQTSSPTSSAASSSCSRAACAWATSSTWSPACAAPCARSRCATRA